MSLKGKKFLITAGPVWIPIDRIRVISNISTGETGFYIAKEAEKEGADVTLVLGPAQKEFFNKKIKIIHFKFFDELKKILREKLISKEYDILIHSAAVSDYRPEKKFKGKIKGNLKRLNLVLKPTEKLVDSIKRYDPEIFLVVFKLEFKKDTLIKDAYRILKHSNADLAVANTFEGEKYRGYILDKENILAYAQNKKELAKRLIKEITYKLTNKVVHQV